MGRDIDFHDNVTVVPADWLNAIQEVISAGSFNFRVEKASATSIRVPAGADDAVAGIVIDGKMRYTNTTKTLTISGPANANYNVWATADTPDRNFALVADTTVSPAGATSWRLIAQFGWDGSAINTDVKSLISSAPTDSPTFTGTPTVPTPLTSDNSQKIVNSAWAQAVLGNYLTTASASSTYLSQASAASIYAPKASPTFTGTVAVPDIADPTTDYSTKPATTGFVHRNTKFKQFRGGVVDTNISIAAPGAGPWDSVTPANGQTWLLIAQTNGAENGPWVYNGAATPMTRPVWWPSGSLQNDGVSFFPLYGTAYGSSLWTTTVAVTVDTTAPVIISQQAVTKPSTDNSRYVATTAFVKTSVANNSMAGTLAARPAATAVSSGTLYLATNDFGGTLYRSNGSSWVQAALAVTPNALQMLAPPRVIERVAHVHGWSGVNVFSGLLLMGNPNSGSLLSNNVGSVGPGTKVTPFIYLDAGQYQVSGYQANLKLHATLATDANGYGASSTPTFNIMLKRVTDSVFAATPTIANAMSISMQTLNMNTGGGVWDSDALGVSVSLPFNTTQFPVGNYLFYLNVPVNSNGSSQGLYAVADLSVFYST